MDEHVSSTRITIEHVTLRSRRSFEAVRSALEASVPPLDHAYAKLLFDHKADEARELLERQAPLSIFGSRDHGGLLLTAGLTAKAIQYVIGKPADGRTDDKARPLGRVIRADPGAPSRRR